MAIQEELLGTTTTAVVDPLSLYRIAMGHTPKGAALRDSVRSGRIRLVTPAVSFAVACSMRTCWDEECEQGHQHGAGVPLRTFQERGGVDIVDMTPTDTLSAGQLYAGCSDRRVVGPEVLAACHSVLLARSRRLPLLSAARAAYCYSALADAGTSYRIDLI
ncbi:hypothetical protein KPP03845_103352 [Streptomyces xanthophaeus]|uniref:hypothetical protein n=1 Tax=Streptomyces xanthophaeus TaxID=67385 RepID=UPI00233F563E|nr:hypothetical protein [Streptomyces xanthophaeus]WCD86986.1 hypothetical protein KPP03845_103352 [Streptomyces xanthophaeus]